MKNTINNIINNVDIDNIYTYIIRRIYVNGAIDISDMEILSYLALYSPEKFKEYQDTILNIMAIPYKQTECNTLIEQIFVDYLQHLNDTHNHHYTPIQASVLDNINDYKCFSFSAPTSTGKSFVFMNLIKENQNDTVIVVPSIALINEYYDVYCSFSVF